MVNLKYGVHFIFSVILMLPMMSQGQNKNNLNNNILFQAPRLAAYVVYDPLYVGKRYCRSYVTYHRLYCSRDRYCYWKYGRKYCRYDRHCWRKPVIRQRCWYR